MILLFNHHAEGTGSVRASIKLIVVGGVAAMTFFIVFAIFTVVGYSNGMESVHQAVASYVA
jgi:hypothetical protein